MTTMILRMLKMILTMIIKMIMMVIVNNDGDCHGNADGGDCQ